MLISVLSSWLSWNVNFVELFDKFIIDECVPKLFLKKINIIYQFILYYLEQ